MTATELEAASLIAYLTARGYHVDTWTADATAIVMTIHRAALPDDAQAEPMRQSHARTPLYPTHLPPNLPPMPTDPTTRRIPNT
jgi:hypothetical protein